PRPVDGAVLEVVQPAIMAVGVKFVGGRVAQHTSLPAQAGIFGPDIPMDLVGAGGGRPEDGAALEVVVMPDTRSTDRFGGRGLAEKARGASEGVVFVGDLGVGCASITPVPARLVIPVEIQITVAALYKDVLMLNWEAAPVVDDRRISGQGHAPVTRITPV